jgi:hypothetical protein
LLKEAKRKRNERRLLFFGIFGQVRKFGEGSRVSDMLTPRQIAVGLAILTVASCALMFGFGISFHSSPLPKKFVLSETPINRNLSLSLGPLDYGLFQRFRNRSRTVSPFHPPSCFDATRNFSLRPVRLAIRSAPANPRPVPSFFDFAKREFAKCEQCEESNNVESAGMRCCSDIWFCEHSFLCLLLVQTPLSAFVETGNLV